ncbi:DNA mismatch repair protein mutS [Paracoccidioides lutzii Pb01]|uniref:DNA mismatch repair protein MSH3 n=1 Tax=Paracoccidioides lutzii (strain ATCC MYA-826 / Pb01) TaxID=502779 RepID=C1H2C3_PARBA|nr:DNA mismatch repair protein mutS [Paracoccidioides lutzii Pb01]EEH33703.2 DNA mismatch repair protein mutS [Paracoccidioides lutzii Pb01]
MTDSAKLNDLPQGRLKSLEPFKPHVNDAPQYPTVIQGAKNNMLKFKNCVLLTRVGNFYELYFEQAEEYAKLLNLKLGQKRTTAGVVPMAGFPYFQLERFLKILVQDLNKYVAISEEYRNDEAEKAKSGGLQYDRKVARIVTPGTLIDEKFMDPSENNFLLSVYMAHTLPEETEILSPEQHPYISGSRSVAQMLPSAITRINAREIVIDLNVDDKFKQELQAIVGQDQKHLLTSFQCQDQTKTLSDWSSVFESPITPDAASTFTTEETASCNILLEYVHFQTRGMNMKLQVPRRRHLDQSMTIDRNSLKGLEILETARDGLGKGSLLHAVRRTSTKSGARLLRDRLTSPSASLHIINERLDLVSKFLADEDLRQNITLLLKRSYDSQRLVQQFSLGRGEADDLICLSKTIQVSRDIKDILLQNIESSDRPSDQEANPVTHSLRSMLDRLNLDGLETLSKRILGAIDEEGLLQKQRIEDDAAAEAAALAQQVIFNEGSPEDLEAMPKKIQGQCGAKQKESNEVEQSDGDVWVIRRDASEKLQELHDKLDYLNNEKSELTLKLQDITGTDNLSLKWTPALGHIVHVKGAKASQQTVEALKELQSVSSSKSTRSFYLSSWTQLGARIGEAKEEIKTEQQRVLRNLREDVILNLVKLRRNAAVLAELDVACSFANLAEEQRMVRPVINNGTSHKIVGGRHPTVKLGLEEQGRPFVSNDCFIGEQERIWLITGPNMAGKSTFLRQNALITLLAQVGSFVPAEHAEIGVVDQIFSRIGAADDLFRNQSTFMVEMLETAAILKNATSHSFVIMDEVGRGTTPEDGTAVGFACLRHLHNVNQCRTLFATHFYALADMTAGFERLARYCTDLKEDSSGSFSFDHRLRKGVNRRSHALKIARLAGLPESVIDVAKDVLGEISGGGSYEPEENLSGRGQAAQRGS